MSKRRILILDDEVDVARSLEERLSRLGYEVVAIASSDAEARIMAAAAAPDLVLIDLAFRDEIDSLTARAASEPWMVPVLFLVPATDEAGLTQAEVTEPHGYLAEPYTERELRVTIELALQKHDSVRAVHDLEDRFFSESVDLLCFLDFNGHFKRVNPAWERTLGFTRTELMARPFIEFVHPDDRERTLKQNAIVRGGGKALAFENRYLCKDGTYRWFRWNAAPDSAKQVIYSVARDITESKQAEEEREALVRQLQAALAEVNTLREILPICSYCRKIRDDENYWHTVEGYISRHTSSRFSHSICPSCMVTEVEAQLEMLERE